MNRADTHDEGAAKYIRYFALSLGVVYTLVGILGFIPGINATPPADAYHIKVTSAYGFLLSLFPVNVIHDLVHLAVGLAGIATYRSLNASRQYARSVGIVFGLLTIMGLIHPLDTVFGLIPIFKHDVWLHALTSLSGLYFGFVHGAEGVTSGDRVGGVGAARPVS